MRLIMGQETVLLFENESSINICGTECTWSEHLEAEELVCWPGTEKESKAVPQKNKCSAMSRVSSHLNSLETGAYLGSLDLIFLISV